MNTATGSGVSRPGRIRVLAGVNGSGKSSLMGQLLIDTGAGYFNPDTFTRQLLKLDPSLSFEEANSKAWHAGRTLLEEAIAAGTSFNFETTLGANTIPALLRNAATSGAEVVMWYCGLATPEMNIRRVAARVAKGGHHIPEAKIRARWDSSRQNLIRLLPFLTELRVFDNSIEATAENGFRPAPVLLLHLEKGKILVQASKPPEWALPIILAAQVTSNSL